MIGRKLPFFAIAIITLVGSPLVFADVCSNCPDTMTLKKSVAPVPANYPGVSLDILGIKPGMSLQAVEHIMASKYKSKPSATSGKADFVYKSIDMNSQPFVTDLSGGNNEDSIDVSLGTPATGNTVVGVSRVLQFSENPKTEPTLKAVYAALDKKYGPETPPSRYWTGNGIEITWVFGEHGMRKSCTRSSCYCPSSTFTAPNWQTLLAPNEPSQDQGKDAYSEGTYACVVADISTTSGDPTHLNDRVSQLNVNVDDPADKVLTIKEAGKQLRAAALAAYQKEAKPEKVPNL